jgi:hypothetical protein
MNACSHTFTPPYVFMAWYLVKQRGNFTFYVYFIMDIAMEIYKE